MIWVITKREFSHYFSTPVAYVYILMFLMASSAFTFYLGDFFSRGQADLQPFFNFHPWLYLLFMPAVAMGLWAQERNSGTLELLMTLPLPLWQAVLGKFLAAWFFSGLSLLLTVPLWLTVHFLGAVDHGVVVSSYLASWLMAGAFIAIGCCMSALSRNQVVAFILTVAVSFLFLLSGLPLVLDMFQQFQSPYLLQLVSGLSFLVRFEALSKGVIDARDVVYFAVVIMLWLILTVQVLAARKGAGV